MSKMTCSIAGVDTPYSRPKVSLLGYDAMKTCEGLKGRWTIPQMLFNLKMALIKISTGVVHKKNFASSHLSSVAVTHR